MIPNNFIDFYGDQTRWFLGSVVDVNDPMKLGRAKVKVYGVYDEIKDDDLPWAQIVVPITQGIHEGKGQNIGLLVGTQVFGMFLDGQSSQLPLIIGTVPKEGDTNEKAIENYPLNKVYETETGHFKEYDDTEGNERIREQHKSGTYYEIDKDGNMTIDTTESEVRTITIKASGQINVTAPVVNVNGNVVKLNS